MASNLPALATSRPFIAPRMSLGMKVAVGFLALLGVLAVTGIMLSLSEIMHRLDRTDQAAEERAAPQQLRETEQAVTAIANTAPHAYPVQERQAEAALALPPGAVVQQLMPYQDGVYLLVSVPREGQRILILDARSGTIRQDIRLENDNKK